MTEKEREKDSQLAAAAIKAFEEGQIRKPKPGDTVACVVPIGPRQGQIGEARVTAVSDSGLQVDGEVVLTSTEQDLLKADAEAKKQPPFELPTLKRAPFCERARLDLKVRQNTWHWPEAETKADTKAKK